MLYVRWNGSLWHTVHAVTKNKGKEVVTECGLVRPSRVAEPTNNKPDKGRHCWNCRKCENG